MRRLPVAAAALALLAVAPAAARGAQRDPVARLANACVTLTPAADRARPVRVYLKPTGLGTFLLQDDDGLLLAAAPAGTTRLAVPGPAAEWRARPARARRVRLEPTSGDGAALLATVRRSHGCLPFPEAGLNATGTPFTSHRKDGTVLGIADAHLHVTADMRAGGRVIYGEGFDRFGITEALGHDEDDHGPDGTLDVTGNLLRTGVPVGTHDTQGWPGFTGWPTYDTNTHQQIYHRWLQRAWMGGLRLVVAQTVEDQPLCEIEPLRSHSCDETATIELQVRRLRALQDYVDAQAGGRGHGWLRIVETPAQARRAIEQGKLAMLIGVESSDPFGCSERLGAPGCRRADVDRVLAHLKSIGVRGMFVAHWVDNALAGAALEGGAKGVFINALQVVQTATTFATGACPEPGQGEELVPGTGPQCNTRGLTPLGEYAVRRMMDEHMLIEVDHLSERARASVLAIAAERHYPLVSSHTGTGGTWTAPELRRLQATGGIATARLDDPAALAARVLQVKREGGFDSVPLGSDTGGFATLPGPVGAGALRYPFASPDGRVRFERQQTGLRTFDLNTDGMAHYGLLPDLLARTAQEPGGAEALDTLMHSAEAYLRMWARTGIGDESARRGRSKTA